MEQGATQRILETARTFVQTKGFNGFSYADISEAVGIKKACIHYHFPSKTDLSRELVRQYRKVFKAGLAQHETKTKDLRKLLEAYFAFHQGLADQNKLCVCGISS
ncbi:MAG: TetR/AcrR family transcriptional regulator [Trueperaceae bacterium]